MSDASGLSFETLNAVLRATAEPTRLRILALLAEAELTVTDLT
ncbi:MAG TPA: ArsR family transcriptional regulator, partial [Xanthobacteraceae bacterium]